MRGSYARHWAEAPDAVRKPYGLNHEQTKAAQKNGPALYGHLKRLLSNQAAMAALEPWQRADIQYALEVVEGKRG